MTQGWFRDRRHRDFANNRMSNIIKNDQPGFHMATYLYVATSSVECHCEILTSLARNALFSKISHTYPTMINHPDPEFGKNTDPFHTAFQLAYNTQVAYFVAGGWITKDPQETRKFGLALVILQNSLRPAQLTRTNLTSLGALGPTSDPGVAADFPWGEIYKGKDGIVDIGGGQGTLCCSLAVKSVSSHIPIPP